MKPLSHAIRTGALLALLAGAAASPTAAWAGDLGLQKVELEEGDGTTVTLRLNSSAEGAAISTFTMTAPHRLVVDIADAKADASAVSGLLATGLVSAATV